MLGGQAIDLVLAPQQSDEPAAGRRRCKLVKASGKDLPVIAIADRVDEASLSQAFAGGVRGIALRNKPQQLLGAVRTEWADLEARRSLRQLEAQVRETERRCDALIESSRDPIAYVHEGMHIRANGAYLEMFGFESFDDIEGMSLLDLVAPQHVDDFKQLLKSLSKGETPPPRYELEAHDTEGNALPAVMEFTPGAVRGRTLPAGRVPPPGGRPGTGTRSRGTAPARPGHRPAQPPDVPARARGRRRRRRAEPGRSTACCCSNRTTTSGCCRKSAWIRADALLAAIAERLRGVLDAALADDASPRASANTAFAVLVRGTTTSRPRRWPSASARPSPSHVFEVGNRSQCDHREHRRRADRREDRQRHAGAGQGQPRRAVVDRRRRQPHRDLRPERGRPRRGRAHPGVGRAHRARRSTTIASCCTTSR